MKPEPDHADSTAQPLAASSIPEESIPEESPDDAADSSLIQAGIAIADGADTNWAGVAGAFRPEDAAPLGELKKIAAIARHFRSAQAGADLRPRSEDQQLAAALYSKLVAKRPQFAPFASGELIGGRYRVQSALGRGGMGAVYEAWDEELAIPVALKTLRLDARGGASALRRLKQEAMLARAVVHPNVCRVYDLGCHRAGDEIWFLTMEVLRGGTLAEQLRRRGRFSVVEAWPLVEQMTAGLAAAHAAGIVHLDFKGSNVMLMGEIGHQQAVITDFGLARAVNQPGLADVSPVGMAGTAAYMAPEQVRGEVAGPAADVYALGVVLYEMITGTLPFSGGTPLEVARRRLDTTAPSARSIVPDLDPHWDAAIGRCLAREPEDRFQRVEQVVDSLAGRLDDQGDRRTIAPGYMLPADGDRFVGRDDELAALERAIQAGARLVTLLGAGGMGKTRMARQYGRLSHGAWPGGVWFCDLTDARDQHGIVSAIGKSLDVPMGKTDPVEQLGYAIAGRGRCLVILDNTEQVISDTTTNVDQWLVRAPSAVFVITSRQRLGSRHESILDVGPMPADPALELFIERARRLRPGLELSTADLTAAREVVRLVEGIPLAIELAAARMRVMNAQQLVAGMRKRFSLLTGGSSERHETLAAAIEGSWELLQPWEKAGFAQCSVFEGGFTLEAAESVVSLTTYANAPSIVDVLQSLHDQSLLRTWMPERASGIRMPRPRFGMLVTLQEYARRKLEAEGAVPLGGSGTTAVRAAEQRHGQWYGRLGAKDAVAALDHHHGLEKRRALENELENLLAASRRAAARGEAAIATASYCAAWEAMSFRGPYGAGVELGKELLAGELPATERALVLLTLGQSESDSGALGDACSAFEAALAIYREQKNRAQEGIALAQLATAQRLQGRVDDARSLYEAALAIHREGGDRRAEGIVRANLGGLAHELGGRTDEAIRHYEAALAILREVGDRRWEGVILGNIGNVHYQLGDLEKTRTLIEASLAIHQEVGNRRYEGIVLSNLGLVHQLQNRLDDARSYYQRALAIHRDVGNRRSEGIAIARLGHLYFEQNRMAEARSHHEAALAIHREVGDQRWEGIALGNLGSLYYRDGRMAEARETLERGEELLRKVKALVDIPKILCVRAEVENGLGNRAAARALFGEAEAMAAQAGSAPDSEVGIMLAKLRQTLA